LSELAAGAIRLGRVGCLIAIMPPAEEKPMSGIIVAATALFMSDLGREQAALGTC
jgi:hypothetical protein